MFAWFLQADVAAAVGWLSLIMTIAGLVLTVAVYKSTSAIRQAFLISARVPQQLSNLRECASAISEYLAGDDLGNASLRRDVVRLGEIASSIAEKIQSEGGSIAARLHKLSMAASGYEEVRVLERLTDIYVQTQGACEALDQWLQDRDWRTHNGS